MRETCVGASAHPSTLMWHQAPDQAPRGLRGALSLSFRHNSRKLASQSHSFAHICFLQWPSQGSYNNICVNRWMNGVGMCVGINSIAQLRRHCCAYLSVFVGHKRKELKYAHTVVGQCCAYSRNFLTVYVVDFCCWLWLGAVLLIYIRDWCCFQTKGGWVKFINHINVYILKY